MTSLRDRNWISLLAKCDNRRRWGGGIHSIFSCFKNLNSINKRNWQSVPSDGGIIISLFNATISRVHVAGCLLFVWVEKLIKKYHPDDCLSARQPPPELTQASKQQTRSHPSDERDFNLMIPDGSVGTAYSAWRTKAIRSELNVNRRHNGTFMKTTLNSREKFAVKHVFDLWKRLINFFPLRAGVSGERTVMPVSRFCSQLPCKFMFTSERNCGNSRSTSDERFYRVPKHLQLSKNVQHGFMFKSELILLPIMFRSAEGKLKIYCEMSAAFRSISVWIF